MSGHLPFSDTGTICLLNIWHILALLVDFFTHFVLLFYTETQLAFWKPYWWCCTVSDNFNFCPTLLFKQSWPNYIRPRAIGGSIVLPTVYPSNVGKVHLSWIKVGMHLNVSHKRHHLNSSQSVYTVNLTLLKFQSMRNLSVRQPECLYTWSDKQIWCQKWPCNTRKVNGYIVCTTG